MWRKHGYVHIYPVSRGTWTVIANHGTYPNSKRYHEYGITEVDDLAAKIEGAFVWLEEQSAV